MNEHKETKVIISGYFNPFHGGHLDLIEGGRQLGDKLIAIVNNDEQQRIKKGKVIMKEEVRLRIVKAIRFVDEAFLSVDKDPTQIETLKLAAKKYADDKLIFANGGDRNSGEEIPETAICSALGIELAFGVGGDIKADSSTRINQETGQE